MSRLIIGGSNGAHGSKTMSATNPKEKPNGHCAKKGFSDAT